MAPVLYQILVVFVILGGACFSIVLDLLNMSHANTKLPTEFGDVYDEEKYAVSQNYLKDCTRLEIFKGAFFSILLTVFFFLGGFNLLDQAVRSIGWHSIPTGIGYMFALLGMMYLVSLPFSIADTFVIEARYGFNKTTTKTFVLDQVKMVLVSVILGGIALLAVLWFFDLFGQWAWIWAWMGLSVFQLLIAFVAPVLIFPIFNKFTPLAEGDLRQRIELLAQSQHFPLRDIVVVDSSKRSTKTNAYFSGFGRFRRIALFDTLLEHHANDEILAIVAHEMGHYKKEHIITQMGLSFVSSGFMFFLFSLFLNNPAVFKAFQMEHLSVYASLVFFGVLFSPINQMVSIFGLQLSRRHEYEADAFAVENTQDSNVLIRALKHLSVHNMGNLTPHPWKVFWSYSHPPIMERVKRLKHLCPPCPPKPNS